MGEGRIWSGSGGAERGRDGKEGNGEDERSQEADTWRDQSKEEIVLHVHLKLLHDTALVICIQPNLGLLLRTL